MSINKSTYEQLLKVEDKLKGKKLKLVIKDNFLGKEKIALIRSFIIKSGVKEF